MKKDVVKILPLGGQAEMGKSMYCIEIKEQIFILDAGFRFPEVSKLGVDIIIPSFDYLKENKDRIINQIRKRKYKPQPVKRVQIPKKMVK